MNKGAKDYFRKIKKLINWLEEEQYEKIIKTAEIITEAIIEKKTIWAFGCTHSSMLTAEIFYRAGGLMVFNGIFPPGLWLNEIPPTKTSKIENLAGYAEIIFDENNIKDDDILFLFSTSGRNRVPVEMALKAKKNNVTTIAITSLEYSKNVESRHESGKKLYEIADYVLDNGADKGDAVVEFEDLEQKVGPVSTISGAAILNALSCQIVGNLLDKGITPPVYKSGNLDGAQEFNKNLLREYEDVIKYLPY